MLKFFKVWCVGNIPTSLSPLVSGLVTSPNSGQPSGRLRDERKRPEGGCGRVSQRVSFAESFETFGHHLRRGAFDIAKRCKQYHSNNPAKAIDKQYHRQAQWAGLSHCAWILFFLCRKKPSDFYKKRTWALWAQRRHPLPRKRLAPVRYTAARAQSAAEGGTLGRSRAKAKPQAQYVEPKSGKTAGQAEGPRIRPNRKACFPRQTQCLLGLARRLGLPLALGLPTKGGVADWSPFS